MRQKASFWGMKGARFGIKSVNLFSIAFTLAILAVGVVEAFHR